MANVKRDIESRTYLWPMLSLDDSCSKRQAA